MRRAPVPTESASFHLLPVLRSAFATKELEQPDKCSRGSQPALWTGVHGLLESWVPGRIVLPRDLRHFRNGMRWRRASAPARPRSPSEGTMREPKRCSSEHAVARYTARGRR